MVMDFSTILQRLPALRTACAESKETLLSNLIMVGEIPAPTYGEAARVNFLRDRFNECGLAENSVDEAGNVMAIVPGTERQGSILVAAHVDTSVAGSEDHSISVLPDQAAGIGLSDNSLGVAALISLPTLIERLDLHTRQDLILLGTSRSLGRGNLEGMRFFLENNEREIKAGVCVEGVRLGRLSFGSIGMLRGEITCAVPEEYDWSRFGASGAIVTLNEVINKISAIPLPRRPRSSVVFGSIHGGTSYSTIPSSAVLRFEIRSESSELVNDISQRIEDIAAEVRSQTRAEVKVDIFARREPGGITFSHPLARCCRQIMKELDLDPRVAPSTSELSALIDYGIPAVTIGLTRGQSIDKPGESVEIEPTFTGLAQLLGIILAIDGEDCHEH